MNLASTKPFDIGSAICQLREAYGITQTCLANAFGVSRQTIIKYENGNAKKALHNVKKIGGIAEALSKLSGEEVTVEDILALTDATR